MNKIKMLIKKIKEMPQGVKASLVFFVATLITSGINYLTTPIYTRLMLPEEFGQAATYMTWMSVFGIVAMFCLSYGVFNNGMVDYPDDRDCYSFSMLTFSNIITVIFGIIIISIFPVIKDIIKIDFNLMLLMLAVFMLQPAYSFWTARQRYEYKYKFTAMFSVVMTLLSQLASILAVYFIKDNRLYGKIFGLECILILFYIGFYIYLAYKAKLKIKFSYWKIAFLFNLPLIPHYLSMYLLNSSDKIMIQNIIGDSAVAFYSVAHSIAAVLAIIWSAANVSLIPYTYEQCKNNNHKNINKVAMPILVLFAFVCGLIVLMAPELVRIMSTKEYYSAIYVIPPLVGGVFIQVQYYLYANILYYYKKTIYSMIASVLSAGINIALNYVFIKKFGYIAAGYTTIVSYLIQAAINFLAVKYVLKINAYNMKFITILTMGFVAIMLVTNLVYPYPVVRYGIIVLIIILGIVFRKKILEIFKTFKKEKQKDESSEENNNLETQKD